MIQKYFIFFLILFFCYNCHEKKPRIYPFFIILNDTEPPEKFTYSNTSANYQVCVPIEKNSPVPKTNADSYSITPELSLGLVLHPKTGVISGTPMTIGSDKNYTIQAKNKNGTTETTIHITVSNSTNRSCQEKTTNKPL